MFSLFFSLCCPSVCFLFMFFYFLLMYYHPLCVCVLVVFKSILNYTLIIGSSFELVLFSRVNDIATWNCIFCGFFLEYCLFIGWKKVPKLNTSTNPSSVARDKTLQLNAKQCVRDQFCFQHLSRPQKSLIKPDLSIWYEILLRFGSPFGKSKMLHWWCSKVY